MNDDADDDAAAGDNDNLETMYPVLQPQKMIQNPTCDICVG
jgi:hypothetical protein